MSNLGRVAFGMALAACALNGCRDERTPPERSTRDTNGMAAKPQAGDAPRAPFIEGKSHLTTDQFAADAASAGRAEVALSRLAIERSQDGALKQFAERMINDHGKANDELQKIAEKKDLTLPAEFAPKQKAAVDTIGQQSGSTFDRLYAAQMLKDHQEAVALFEKASTQDSLDPDLRRFAAERLPTLKDHLEHAKQLSTQIGSR